jgi:hypothetical protein
MRLSPEQKKELDVFLESSEGFYLKHNSNGYYGALEKAVSSAVKHFEPNQSILPVIIALGSYVEERFYD